MDEEAEFSTGGGVDRVGPTPVALVGMGRVKVDMTSRLPTQDYSVNGRLHDRGKRGRRGVSEFY